MDSLAVTDAAAADVAVAPRVTLAEIEQAILYKINTTGSAVAEASMGVPNDIPELKILSISLLVMRNGFTVLGKSAPASPENFNRELGARFAYEDAIRQLWPLMGFALRDRLARMDGASR